MATAADLGKGVDGRSGVEFKEGGVEANVRQALGVLLSELNISYFAGDALIVSTDNDDIARLGEAIQTQFGMEVNPVDLEMATFDELVAMIVEEGRGDVKVILSVGTMPKIDCLAIEAMPA